MRQRLLVDARDFPISLAEHIKDVEWLIQYCDASFPHARYRVETLGAGWDDVPRLHNPPCVGEIGRVRIRGLATDLHTVQ